MTRKASATIPERRRERRSYEPFLSRSRPPTATSAVPETPSCDRSVTKASVVSVLIVSQAK